MLPTFVIGLREGLEAALIVGMVAAFCVRSGRRDALRWVGLGVAIAVVLCTAVGVALRIVQQDLPQKQQEGLETVVGIIAVAMVTYMVVWMRRNSRNLSKQLEGVAGDALAAGSVSALIAMSFLAVLREGFETAVFALAAFNSSQSPASSGGGLILGIALAVALGYGIYRGGVSINLSKFFRVTGLVLVLVAAGLVLSALHTAHEAGWLNVGQGSTIDLSWLVQGGSVRSALLTGMLGLQPHPVVIELVGWLAYLVPVGLYVAWPPKRRAPWRTIGAAAGFGAIAAGVAAAVLAFAAPTLPSPRHQLPSGLSGTLTTIDPTTRVQSAPATASAAQLTDITAGDATLGVAQPPLGFGRHVVDAAQQVGGLSYAPAGAATVDGLRVLTFTATQQAKVSAAQAGSLPRSITADQLRAGAGRLPLGVNGADLPASIPLAYTDALSWTVTVEPRSGDVVDVALTLTRTAGAQVGSSLVTLSTAQSLTLAGEPAAVQAAARAAASDGAAVDSARLRGTVLPWTFGGVALVLAALAGVAALGARRARNGASGTGIAGGGSVAAGSAVGAGAGPGSAAVMAGSGTPSPAQ
jgi:high-affinity iron transporter